LETNEIFDTAFDEATGKGGDGTDGTSGVIGELPEETSTPPDSSSTTSADLGSAGTGGYPDASGTAGTAPAATDDTAEQRYRTLKGIHKADKEKWEADKKKSDDEIERLKASKTAPDPAKPIDPYAGFTDKEKEDLQAYDTEYDTVAKFEGLKRRAELNVLKGELTNSLRAEFTEAFKVVLDTLAPALSTTEQLSDERHFNSIKAQHPDFEKYRDDGSIEAWIDTKRESLRAAYTKDYNEGSAQNIIDLITDFKKENNIGPVIPAPDPAAPLDTEKERKREAIAGVKSRKTPASFSQKASDDFEGAFDEAAAKQ
jgi:hypothetical protein